MKAANTNDQTESQMQDQKHGLGTQASPLALSMRMFRRKKGAMVALAVVLLLILAAVFAFQLMPNDPFRPDPPNALRGPQSGYLLGTDNIGRCVFSRMILGARWSLSVGLIAVGVSLIIGLPMGLAAGFFGGIIDNVISRIIDVLLSVPAILLAMAIVAILGPGLGNIMIAVGITGVPRFARVIRSSTLSAREEVYVEAARAVGVSLPRLMVKHILPNTLAPIIVLTTLRVATAILAASSLGFLGLGAQPPIPEWGAMLSGARAHMRTAWWLTTFPGIAIMITVLAMNVVGDGLRDALDPRLRGSS